MGRFTWQVVAGCQAALGLAGLGFAVASGGEGALGAWYAFGPAWLLLAAYSWRNKPGPVADAPAIDTVVLLGGAILALFAGLLIGL